MNLSRLLNTIRDLEYQPSMVTHLTTSTGVPSGDKCYYCGDESIGVIYNRIVCTKHKLTAQEEYERK